MHVSAYPPKCSMVAEATLLICHGVGWHSVAGAHWCLWNAPKDTIPGARDIIADALQSGRAKTITAEFRLRNGGCATHADTDGGTDRAGLAGRAVLRCLVEATQPPL